MDLAKFLPNEHNRRMFPGFVAFCLAAFGVAVGFFASALNLPWLFAIAFVIAVLGVLGGFIFILVGWWNTFTGKWK